MDDRVPEALRPGSPDGPTPTDVRIIDQEILSLPWGRHVRRVCCSGDEVVRTDAWAAWHAPAYFVMMCADCGLRPPSNSHAS